MKAWIVLFLLLLAVGVAWGLARDLFSRERGVQTGAVEAVDRGGALPKWLPATPPHFTVRLADGRTVNVATRNAQGAAIGDTIKVMEWVTPWGQVWYTQRD